MATGHRSRRHKSVGGKPLSRNWTDGSRTPAPEDHTREYDRVIRMVEMEVRDEIEIVERDFQSFVMDDCDWSANWASMFGGYGGTMESSSSRGGQVSVAGSTDIPD